MIYEIVRMACLTCLISVACYTELRSSRIPNALTGPGMLLGLALGYAQGGPALVSSLVGLLSGFGVLFVFYAVGGMGGGDVKLMGAVGAFVGSERIIGLLFHTALAGAAIAVLMLVWKGRVLERLKAGGRRLFAREADPASPALEPLTVPYGLAIAIGVLLTLFQVA